ncbi:ornithine carbamoyltransferase [Buchnera aphidicola]|uniref:Ornithine carbamoyltransferase n=1 Tax=Buchnera aphidicola (Anoecia oenotherae) TaxID=1241833 RepID=A0A4D6XV82_9GAMM|nr:ornithine carbamoyltransferase [Buchnera aphidicola]QCI19409.1 ornithine carbamoyltransferase [Buchnera aphidicola (Anoecia oenotherae)]
MNKIYKKNFLRILDFNKAEIDELLHLAQKLKVEKKKNNEKKYLKGKNIALIFEKESTRTKCSIEIAAFDQGANTTYLESKNSHIGYKESIRDTARTLTSIYDGIFFRGVDHNNIDELALFSYIPVWNALTKQYHPTQMLADMLTIKEDLHDFKSLSDIKLAYIGDSNNNISNSLIEISTLYKFDFRIISPKKYLRKTIKENKYINNLIEKNKNILFTDNIDLGLKNVDYVYTDVWLSMGDDNNQWTKTIDCLYKYQVNEELLTLTNNKNVKVLHCLPALHDKKTVLSKNINSSYNLNNGIEITNSVFEKNKEIIFRQSENKLHTIKSLLILSLNKTIN